MAVKACYLKAGSRVGPHRRKDGTVEYRETWIVRTDDPQDDGQVVEKANALPKVNTAYPEDASAILVDRLPRQSVEQPVVWEVELRYVYGGPSSRDPLPGEDPTKLPARRSWSSIEYEIQPLTDLDSKPFLNSAGDRLDPPPRMVKRNALLTIQLNLFSFDNRQASEYRNTINEAPITVMGHEYAAHTAKINEYSGRENFIGEVRYWQITVVIEFDEQDKWHPFKQLDHGPRVRRHGLTGLFMARDEAEVAFGGRVLLDGNGHLKPESLNPVYLNFKLYHAKPFANLNLPLE